MRLQNDTNKYGPDYSQPVEPANKFAGCLWYDTTVNKLKVWTGTFWRWDGMEPIRGGDLGYISGGNSNASSIERFLFPFSNGISTVVGNTAFINTVFAGVNSSIALYMMGNDTGNSSKITKMLFPFDSGTAPGIGNMTNTTYYPAGFNSSLYGYSCGTLIGSTVYSHIERMQFSNDAAGSSQAASLSANTYYCEGFNSSLFGYVAGGMTVQASTVTSKVDRYDFTSGGNAVNVGSLTYTKYGCIAFNSSLHGYSVGGYRGYGSVSYTSNIDKIAFPFNGGSSVVQGGTNTSDTCLGTGCNSPLYGYNNYGGFSSANYNLTQTQRFAFPFDFGVNAVLTGFNAYGSGKVHPKSGDNTDFVAQFV